ncbi:snf2 family helicase ATPase [Sporothrix schenckii 1099-18]|uniref:Snf2 family helicase ATPase n=1 Tax=Sporothrix schenckii 1099-18 TaxID=1397361 RepID=A0A0F2M3Q3_SPOSC|nr:snf2 family helicase ATPase [Sporothrix schenckii 1099-18]KJR84328.1 snf2 family helicase ATPase [Sporothrix schenckii 1099-18]
MARHLSSPSDVGTDCSSPANVMTSPPSSPPAHEPVKTETDDATEITEASTATLADISSEDQALIEAEERRARKANAVEEERRLAAARRKNKKKANNKAEREAKGRELDELLKQSAAFSDILTKKTQVLGRVGSGFDGQTLGEHDLQMATQPKCLVGGTMRDYQLEGLTWMLEICLQNMSGILADEMGLGKTVQTISLIALLREQENYLGPHLIVAPLSTLNNWINEFQHWTPSIPVVMYHGTPQQRKDLFTNRIQKHLSKGRPTDQFPVVCTSYEIILRDRADLSKINWEFIIIDEGHRMKNFDSKLFRELQSFRSATRFLITGTPLQNNLKELWSLLNFLMPKIFTDWEAFSSWFDFSELQDEDTTAEFIEDRMKQDLVKKIHMVLQPLLLRRVKADVASYLPKKREYILYAPMTKEQTGLYNAISDKTVDTRAYLENKVAEHLTEEAASRTPPPSSRPSRSSRSSRASTVVAVKEEETGEEEEAKPSKGRTKSSRFKAPQAKVELISVPIRSSPRAKKTVETPPAPAIKAKNAFAVLMGKSKTNVSAAAAAVPVASIETAPPAATKRMTTNKRKTLPTTEEPASKSAKSSRHSTPGSSFTAASDVSARDLSRTRTRRRRTYHEADASDEDKMSDDEFEAALRDEYAAAEEDEGNESGLSGLSGEEIQRVQTLELAKREIANKKLGNPLMQLRLVCNSPHNFYNPWSWSSESGADRPIDESIVTSSGKMLLLDRLLPSLFRRGHKVLIFSQFKTQLDLLEAYCAELRRWKVCRIDGSVAHADRQAQIDLFNRSPRYKLFLLSTRAGGQGINLASADTVILFDSDWNPQQDLQAQDRAHRIGQTRPVVVYRLATKGTVEEDLLMSADAKRRLEKLVIKKGGFRTMDQKLKPTMAVGASGDDGAEEGEGNDLDADTLRSLLLKDGQVYTVSGDSDVVLSDHDLDVLCDRSDEAYAQAASGQGDAAAFKVIETGVNGITESFKTAAK